MCDERHTHNLRGKRIYCTYKGATPRTGIVEVAMLMPDDIVVDGTVEWYGSARTARLVATGLYTGEVELFYNGAWRMVGRTVRWKFVASDGRSYDRVLEDHDPRVH